MRHFVYVLLASLIMPQISFAEKKFCNGTVKHPCVVQDTFSLRPELNNWRTDSMLLAKYPIANDKTAKPLWLSGSAAPNASGFELIVKRVKKLTQNKVKQVIDVDLRQESHLYLNKQAITLVSKNDWINLGKNHASTIMSEEKWLQTLKKKGVVEGVLTKKQYKSNQYAEGVNVPIQTIETEEQVATAAGMKYVRLTVSDHMGPRDQDVDRYVSLINKLPKNTWIHLHCRGGKGRTSTFFAMTDMLFHADKDTFDNIIKRQKLGSPYYDLTKVNRPNRKLTVFFQARLDFLKKFYQYSQDRLNGYKGPWSAWVLTHNR